MIHEVDPGANYYPMYSIEYKPDRNPTPHMPEVWAQHALTHSKFLARVLDVECRLRYRKGYSHRVRVL